MRRPVLLLLLCAAVCLTVWPALTGDALLDDLQLVPLRRPFPARNLFSQPPRWQPVVPLSFHAVAAVAPRDLTRAVRLHHAASLALYLLTLGLLLEFTRARHPGARVHPWHALVLASFALHPSLVESFGHLAARGEGLALAALAGLALALERGQPLVALGCALLGLAASPIVGPAAAGLALAAATDAPSPRARRAAVAVAVAALLGALLTLRSMPTPVELVRWGRRVPRAVSVATRALLVPTETALRLPHWELSRPLDATGRLTAALPLLASVFLAQRGALDGAALVLGAALSVLPLVLRADFPSFGLDRYLGGAALLLTVAVLRAPPPTWISVLTVGTRRLVAASALAALLLLAFLSRQTATGFTSESHQLDAMTQMRPRDPSGHLRNAWFSLFIGDHDQAGRSLGLARRGPLTTTMQRITDAIATRLGQR